MEKSTKPNHKSNFHSQSHTPHSQIKKPYTLEIFLTSEEKPISYQQQKVSKYKFVLQKAKFYYDSVDIQQRWCRLHSYSTEEITEKAYKKNIEDFYSVDLSNNASAISSYKIIVNEPQEIQSQSEVLDKKQVTPTIINLELEPKPNSPNRTIVNIGPTLGKQCKMMPCDPDTEEDLENYDTDDFEKSQENLHKEPSLSQYHTFHNDELNIEECLSHDENSCEFKPIEMDSIEDISEQSIHHTINTSNPLLEFSNYSISQDSDCLGNSPTKRKTHKKKISQLKLENSSDGFLSKLSPRQLGRQSLQIQENLYISNNRGELLQFNIKTGEIIKDYGKVHNCPILSISSTKGYEFIFTSGYDGALKQWHISKKILCKDFGEISEEGIWCIHCSPNRKYLFVTNSSGFLKQYSQDMMMKDNLIKDYGIPHIGVIYSIVCTLDSRNLFTSDANGSQKQWDIERKSLVKDFGQVHKTQIRSIAITLDYLFTSDIDGVIMQWNTNFDGARFIRNLGVVHNGEIHQIVASIDGKFQFSSDTSGVIKKWEIEEKKGTVKIVKDFGIVHKNAISSLCMCKKGVFQFSCDKYGGLKQWLVESGDLVRDFGKVCGGIVFALATTG